MSRSSARGVAGTYVSANPPGRRHRNWGAWRGVTLVGVIAGVWWLYGWVWAWALIVTLVVGINLLAQAVKERTQTGRKTNTRKRKRR